MQIQPIILKSQLLSQTKKKIKISSMKQPRHFLHQVVEKEVNDFTGHSKTCLQGLILVCQTIMLKIELCFICKIQVTSSLSSVSVLGRNKKKNYFTTLR